ncbi:MAG: site-2 protease family protein [Candidatus Velthaea sp.]|jgi:Zn-dependent protease
MKPRWKSAGGLAVAAALAAAKFKGALLLLLNFKWLLFVPKFLLSFGSIFASIWLYAQFYGWKLAVVFVLLVLVHEMGHWVVIRGFGGQVSLPYFLPGLGAFVAQKTPLQSAGQDAYAALAGPVIGVTASALCWAYGLGTGNSFWTVAAYLGFIINLFNLIPVMPLDGGRIAGVIDPRLWIAGVVLFVVFLVAFHAFGPIGILFLIMIAVSTVPRIRALMRGYVDPRVAALSPIDRGTVALAYFATIVVAGIGAFATHLTHLVR